MNNSMINPSIVDLKERVGDKYSLVVITSKRARQLIQGEKPLVNVDSNKPLTIAISELNQGKVNFKVVHEGIK
ncbi:MULTISPECIES: DNA-directed RNA polymerase subunit omega [Clostridium]|uniref:DNA-directed RNA polymerase subunit omega n=1 Tax=Clostridium TaxID=1485 RepID=UPI00069DE3B0|nr:MULTISPECIES: DNA-directed RNA polymerase subunit omega [Clostridium]KOF58123.1 DNA-directed RNA polymerase subunit omega [Clostridium sp. DMHC 10]MCD2346030.1 DNA-directed RNA polymerase subunit omega [Clostridium guangxiense]